MTKSRVSRRFKLAALRFRRIPDGLARLRLGCRQWRTGVDWHRAYRVALSAIVIGSLLALRGFRDYFADREMAPLLAVVAAMGLAVMAGAHRPEGKPEGKLEIGLNGLVSLATIGAAGLSGFEWLASEDSRLWVQLLGGAGTAFAVLVYGATVYDVIGTMERKDRADEGG